METFDPRHPYYPRDARIPGYLPNDAPLTSVLPAFAAIIGAVIVTTYLLATRRRLSPLDIFAACWFALCELVQAPP
jgi:hypothetical protein